MTRAVQLAYDDSHGGVEGDASPTPTALLVHAFPFDRRMWHPQLEAIRSAGFRAIAPDLRGFGGSPAGGGAPSIDAFADDLVALLDRLHVREVVLAGISMGGYVALSFAQAPRTGLCAPSGQHPRDR